MSIKKRILVILAAVMAFTLVIAGLSLNVFAEDAATGNAFTVTTADGTVTAYQAGTTFISVVAAAPEDSTITLYADTDVNADIALDKSLIIDLNDKTITTTGRITPHNDTHVVFTNGTIKVTAKELAYMDERYSAAATFEFNTVTVKKDTDGANKTLVDMRVGRVVFDGMTINEGEWNANFTSPNALISMGYRTKEQSQTLKLEVKNSNITLSGIPLINGTGASNETLGYTLDVDVTDSYISSTTAVFRAQPSSATSGANSYIDICVSGSSELRGTPLTVNANIPSENITIMLDYGVTSRKPTVGTVILGNDGNGLLDFVNGEFESSNYGTVADLWSDNQTPVTDYAYTFVAVGDTQYTTDSANPEKLHYIYDWIINNKEEQNIQFVFGMGDITNHSRDDEWPVAMEQLNRLNGVVPYSVVRGNHDTTDTFNANLNNETYRSMFEGFYSEDGAENAYVTFTVGEQDFLHITLDYRASNAVLNWAAGIIQQHPQHKVIISTHDYIQHDGTLDTEGASTSGGANSGAQIWNKLVSQYPNIFLVLSGHVFTTDVGRSQMTGVYGNTVTAIITDGQCHDFKNGPMGLISLLHFSEDGKTLTVEYYSTVHNKFFGKNSQFTLEIPEFDLSSVEPPSYLYELTDANGNVLSFADTLPFSMVLSNATAGSTLKLLGDAIVDSGCTAPADVTIDLNGYTLSTDGGRISGNCKLTVTNGTVKIVNYELVYISEGYSRSDVTFLDVDVIHTSDFPTKVLAEVRDGSVTLDNVRIKAEDWLGTNNLLTLGSRTKTESAPIYVTIKNSNISIGASNAVYSGGNSNEVNGYTINVSIENSTITTTGKIFRSSPTDAAAPLCHFNISIDGSTVLKSATIFELNKLSAENISVTIAEGASFAALPAISGVEFSYGGDAFVYSNETAMLTLASTENIDTSKICCKLVKADGSVLCYWEGSVLNQTLVNYAQNASCSIVLVGDMATPAGASSTSTLSITVVALTIDLNNCTLTMSSWSRFLSSASASGTTKFVLKNGTVRSSWNIYHSYSGSDYTSFAAEGVKFVATSSYTSFDLRMGSATFTDCEFEFTSNATSLINVFTLGYTTRTNTVVVKLTGCKFTSTANQRNIFKLYNGQPTDISVTDCDITLGGSSVLVLADNSYKTNAGDKLTVDGCTINTANTKLFTFNYSTIAVTLSETYVKNGASYESANGTVALAKGETKATVADGGYMITKPKVQLSANLSLYTDFTVNIWLPEGTTVSSLNVDGVDYPISSAVKIGDRYRISIRSIGAAEAADAISILITYTDGERTLTVEKAYSVITYAQSIIEADSYSEESKSLIAYVIGYINSVYAYSQKAAPAELSALIASEDYIAALALDSTDGVESVPETETDIGTAVNAISGARLLLDSSVKFIFLLNEGYTGSLTLSYAGSSYECEVVNGTVGECDYVIVDMRAAALYSEVITITAGEYSGTYDLAAYVAGISEDYGTSDELTALLVSLYNYCKEANEYKAYVAESGELN